MDTDLNHLMITPALPNEPAWRTVRNMEYANTNFDDGVDGFPNANSTELTYKLLHNYFHNNMVWFDMIRNYIVSLQEELDQLAPLPPPTPPPSPNVRAITVNATEAETEDEESDEGWECDGEGEAESEAEAEADDCEPQTMLPEERPEHQEQTIAFDDVRPLDIVKLFQFVRWLHGDPFVSFYEFYQTSFTEQVLHATVLPVD